MKTYVGPNDMRCQQVEWKRLRDSREFDMMELYENDDFRVYIRWLGQGNESLPMTWAIFRVIGETFSGGIWVENFSRPAPNLKQAKQYRKELLIQWTESTEAADGTLVEVGNIYEPEPPPDPNRPESAVVRIAENDDGEVW